MSDTNVNAARVEVDDRTFRIDDTGVLVFRRPGSAPTAAPAAEFGVQPAGTIAPTIDIDRLYEAVPGTASNVVRALELLKEATDSLLAAQKADNPIDADRFVQRAQLTFPKLFSCRSIGDGFGVVVNALQFAFMNLHGAPLTSDQLNTVLRVVKSVRARPAISLEQGVSSVEELEDHGFDIDPPDLGDLLEGPDSAEA